MSNHFGLIKFHFQSVRQKLAHLEQVGLQLRHMKHIHDAHSSNFAYCF